MPKRSNAATSFTPKNISKGSKAPKPQTSAKPAKPKTTTFKAKPKPEKVLLNEAAREAARKLADELYRGKCYYEVLGVERTASESQIKQAYHKMAKKWHPDKNNSKREEATEVFKYIHNAYSVINNQTERSWYDSHRESILREARGSFSTLQQLCMFVNIFCCIVRRRGWIKWKEGKSFFFRGWIRLYPLA